MNWFIYSSWQCIIFDLGLLAANVFNYIDTWNKSYRGTELLSIYSIRLLPALHPPHVRCLVDIYFNAAGLYFRVSVFAPCCQYDQIQDRGAVIEESREYFHSYDIIWKQRKTAVTSKAYTRDSFSQPSSWPIQRPLFVALIPDQTDQPYQIQNSKKRELNLHLIRKGRQKERKKETMNESKKEAQSLTFFIALDG